MSELLLKPLAPVPNSLQAKDILVQYSDKFMHSIVLYSIVLHRFQLYCIVNLLLCGYNTIQCYAMSEYWTTLAKDKRNFNFMNLYSVFQDRRSTHNDRSLSELY